MEIFRKLNQLKEIVNRISPITEEDWNAILPFFQEKIFTTNEFVLKKGEVSQYIIFINKGSFRSFYQNDELVETNLLLKSENEFITEYESFITQQASELYIQSLEDSQVVLLPKKDLLTLYESSFYWNKFGRIMSEYIFINSKKRTEELLFLSPEERYLKLLTENSSFFQRYSLKQIAGYLGITPQSLSRIRSRIV